MSNEELPPESDSGSDDPAAESRTNPPEKSSLLTQAELDKIIAAQPKNRSAASRISDQATGPRPDIVKEPIDDPDILRSLLGPDYEQRTAPDDAPIEQAAGAGRIPPFDQDEIDRLVAGRSDRQEHSKLELDSGPMPEIEKEPISDPAILQALLGGDTDSSRSASDSDEKSKFQEKHEPIDEESSALSDLGDIIEELTSIEEFEALDDPSEKVAKFVAEDISSTDSTPPASRPDAGTLVELSHEGDNATETLAEPVDDREELELEGGVAQDDIEALIAATQAESIPEDAGESESPV